jgi:hypothetical protein
MSTISKSEFETGDFEVIGGWDDGIESYFLNVFTRDDEVHWSSVYHGMVDVQDVDVLKACLDDLGIEAPDGFWDNVAGADSFTRFIDGRWLKFSGLTC